MRNEEYWARRMELLSAALLDRGEDYINNLRRQYDGAVAAVEEKILRWFKRFADNNGVSLAEARRLLNSRELREFLWTVEEYIEHGEENALDGRWMKELENASARVHISRLESLKLHLRQTAEELCGAQLRDVPALLGDIYREGFERTAFELQKGAGVGFGFQLPNRAAIEKVLSRPWTTDDLTFSARIWDNRQKLVASVNANLTRMLMTGADVDETTAAIVKDMNTSRYRAERIVRTESAAFISAAQRDCFDELEVERYEIVETPDGRTCGVCGDLDGKVFEMKDYSVGSTAPPFHPNCRGCTAPYYEDMAGLSTRHARDIETGEAYEIPDNMTYNQWREKQKGLDQPVNEKAIKKSEIFGKPAEEKTLDKPAESGIIKTDNKSVREWYVSKVSNIPNEIDTNQPFEDQVKQAFELRNKYKREARIMMSDRQTAETLDRERPVLTFEELLESKMKRKGMTRQEALEDILKTASKTNIDVNKEFGL